MTKTHRKVCLDNNNEEKHEKVDLDNLLEYGKFQITRVWGIGSLLGSIQYQQFKCSI